MFKRIRDCLVEHRRARLERLTHLAQEMDELIAFGRLSNESRQQLQGRREDLQRQARELMFG